MLTLIHFYDTAFYVIFSPLVQIGQARAFQLVSIIHDPLTACKNRKNLT